MLASLSRTRYSLALVAAAASWGVATVISKRAVAEIPPLILLPVQLAVSVGALTVFIRARRLPMSWSRESRRLGLLGILNPGLSYALGLVGLSHITASLSVLLWAVEHLLILVLAWALLGDRLTPLLAGASTLALAGVMLVVFEGGSEGRLFGMALTLAGVAACAVYTVIARKLVVDDSTLTVVAIQQIHALAFAIVLVSAAAFVANYDLLPNVSVGAWISAAVSGVIYYAVAFWFYLTGLRRVTAGVAGVFINLIPVFGVAAAYLLLDERLTARQGLGALLIVVAVGAIVSRQPVDGKKVSSPL